MNFPKTVSWLPFWLRTNANIKATLPLDTALEFLRKWELKNLTIHVTCAPKGGTPPLRGHVVMPYRIGATATIVCFADGPDVQAAKLAGADHVGGVELIETIKTCGVDACITTPTMYSKVTKMARILGPMGLMPNAKSGTVTTDFKRIIQQLRISSKFDCLQNIVSAEIGTTEQNSKELAANIKALLLEIYRLGDMTPGKGIPRSQLVKSVDISELMLPLDKKLFK